MATLMEVVDSESVSQNGLRGVDAEHPAHDKEGTLVTLERPGIPEEAHVADVRTTNNRFYNNSRC